jgi:hypothetical protein
LFAVQGKNGQYLLKSINIPIKIIKKFYDNSGKYIPNEDVVLSGTQFSPTANELIFPYEYFKDNGDGTYSLFAYGGEMTKEIDGETYVDMST